MIYKAILLFVQKYLWSKILRGRIKSKLWTVLGLFVVVFLALALLASVVYNLTFEQSLWLVWSYVDEGANFLIEEFQGF